MLFKARRKVKIKQVPLPALGKTISLQFNDSMNPWKEDVSDRSFTKVGSGPSVTNGQMRNVASKDNYITTPDAPELRLTGDFTLKVGIRDWVTGNGFPSLFQKGVSGNGVNNAGQFFIYGQDTLYITSDTGSQYDVINGLRLPKVNNNVDLTLVRSNNTLYVYVGTTLITTRLVTGKTFGNNASPLNINGGNLTYSTGFEGGFEYWSLTHGEAIFP